MRRLGRHLFTLCALASLLLCVAFCGLWARSYWGASVGYTVHASGDDALHSSGWFAVWDEGSTVVMRQTLREPFEDAATLAEALASLPPSEFFAKLEPDYPLLFTGWIFDYNLPASTVWLDQLGCTYTSLDDTNPNFQFSLRTLAFPAWWPVVLLAVLPAIRAISIASAVRKRRRLARRHCPSCGYDLRASPGRCPECGAAAMR